MAMVVALVGAQTSQYESSFLTADELGPMYACRSLLSHHEVALDEQGGGIPEVVDTSVFDYATYVGCTRHLTQFRVDVPFGTPSLHLRVFGEPGTTLDAPPMVVYFRHDEYPTMDQYDGSVPLWFTASEYADVRLPWPRQGALYLAVSLQTNPTLMNPCPSFDETEYPERNGQSWIQGQVGIAILGAVASFGSSSSVPATLSVGTVLGIGFNDATGDGYTFATIIDNDGMTEAVIPDKMDVAESMRFGEGITLGQSMLHLAFHVPDYTGVVTIEFPAFCVLGVPGANCFLRYGIPAVNDDSASGLYDTGDLVFLDSRFGSRVPPSAVGKSAATLEAPTPGWYFLSIVSSEGATVSVNMSTTVCGEAWAGEDCGVPLVRQVVNLPRRLTLLPVTSVTLPDTWAFLLRVDVPCMTRTFVLDLAMDNRSETVAVDVRRGALPVGELALFDGHQLTGNHSYRVTQEFLRSGAWFVLIRSNRSAALPPPTGNLTISVDRACDNMCNEQGVCELEHDSCSCMDAISDGLVVEQYSGQRCQRARCARHLSCSGCASDPGCSWCATRETCIPGVPGSDVQSGSSDLCPSVGPVAAGVLYRTCPATNTYAQPDQDNGDGPAATLADQYSTVCGDHLYVYNPLNASITDAFELLNLPEWVAVSPCSFWRKHLGSHEWEDLSAQMAGPGCRVLPALMCWPASHDRRGGATRVNRLLLHGGNTDPAGTSYTEVRSHTDVWAMDVGDVLGPWVQIHEDCVGDALGLGNPNCTVFPNHHGDKHGYASFEVAPVFTQASTSIWDNGFFVNGGYTLEGSGAQETYFFNLTTRQWRALGGGWCNGYSFMASLVFSEDHDALFRFPGLQDWGLQVCKIHVPPSDAWLGGWWTVHDIAESDHLIGASAVTLPDGRIALVGGLATGQWTPEDWQNDGTLGSLAVLPIRIFDPSDNSLTNVYPAGGRADGPNMPVMGVHYLEPDTWRVVGELGWTLALGYLQAPNGVRHSVNLAWNQWTVVSPEEAPNAPPTGRFGPSSALSADGSTMFVWGGFGEVRDVLGNEYEWEPLPEAFLADEGSRMYRFDLDTDTWTSVAPVGVRPPVLVLGAISDRVDADGMLWSFGGVDASSLELSSQLWRFDTATNTWADASPGMTNPPPAMGLVGSAQSDTHLYMVGGLENLDPMLFPTDGPEVFLDYGRMAFRMDLATLEWEMLPDMPLPMPFIPPAVFVGARNTLYVLTLDMDSFASLPGVLLGWDAETMIWTRAIEQVPMRFMTDLVEVSEDMLLLGPGQTFSDDEPEESNILLLHLESQTWHVVADASPPCFMLPAVHWDGTRERLIQYGGRRVGLGSYDDWHNCASVMAFADGFVVPETVLRVAVDPPESGVYESGSHLMFNEPSTIRVSGADWPANPYNSPGCTYGRTDIDGVYAVGAISCPTTYLSHDLVNTTIEVQMRVGLDQLVLRSAAVAVESCPEGWYRDPGGADVPCRECPVGSANPAYDSDSCPACAANQVQPLVGQARCEYCPAGHAIPSLDADRVCEPCVPGSFNGNASSELRVEQCFECPVSAYQPEYGATECVACPLHATVGAVGGKSASECRCMTGYWGANATDCAVCPTPGATCVFLENDLPVPEPGYWRDPADPSRILECAVAAACPGGVLSPCATGYAGEACSECADQYYLLNNACLACPANSAAPVIIAGVLMLIFVILLYKFAGRAGMTRNGSSSGFSAGSIALNFVQMTALFAAYKMNWPDEMILVLQWFSVMNLNLDVSSPECAMPITYQTKWMVTMLFPLLVLIGYWTYSALRVLTAALLGLCCPPSPAQRDRHYRAHLALRSENPDHAELIDEGPSPFTRRCCSLMDSEDRKSLFNQTVHACLIFCAVAYTFLAAKSFELFSCSPQTDGSYYLNAYPSILCFEGVWWDVAPWGMVAIVVYGLGIPGAFALVLFVDYPRAFDSQLASKFDIHFARFGFLTSRYLHRWHYWELTIMGRKLAIIATTLFFNNAVVVQNLTALALVFVFVLLQVYSRPYRAKKDNKLEFLLLCTDYIVLFIGILFYSEKLDDTSSTVLTVVGVAVLVGSLLAIIIYMLMEIRKYYFTRRYRHISKDPRNRVVVKHASQVLNEEAFFTFMAHLEDADDDDRRQLGIIFEELDAAANRWRKMTRVDVLQDDAQRAFYFYRRDASAEHIALLERTLGVLEDDANAENYAFGEHRTAPEMWGRLRRRFTRGVPRVGTAAENAAIPVAGPPQHATTTTTTTTTTTAAAATASHRHKSSLEGSSDQRLGPADDGIDAEIVSSSSSCDSAGSLGAAGPDTNTPSDHDGVPMVPLQSHSRELPPTRAAQSIREPPSILQTASDHSVAGRGTRHSPHHRSPRHHSPRH